MKKHMFPFRTSTAHRDLRLTFYREEGCWYADVPGHTQAQNQMVAGADQLIESLDCGSGRVGVVMSSDVDDPKPYLVRLHRIEHDPFGATYWASSGNSPDAPRLSFAAIPIAWLCNVTHDVFGEHPRNLYIHSIQSAAESHAILSRDENVGKAARHRRARFDRPWGRG